MRRFHLFLVLGCALFQANCAGVAGSSSGHPGEPGAPPPPPPPAQVMVVVSPNPIAVRAGLAQPFTALVTGTSNNSVTWQVNGVTGGTASTGTITESGVYAAPATLPNPNTVTVQAVSKADSGAAGQSAVTLWNPTPVLTAISPMSLPQGAFSIAVTGSNFVNAAQVMLAGAPLDTTFSTSTRLQATGTAATVGTFAITVVNPDPGSSASIAINLQVTSGGGNPPPPPALACSAMQTGLEGSLGGFLPFPSDNLWNQDISNAPVDPNSAALINFIGSNVGLHPDFGSGEFDGSIIGIPYEVVDSTQGPVTINFTEFGDESDPGPMPIPLNAPIEGDPNPSGDQHVLILDNSNCWLYELYNASPSGSAWNAGSAAVWDLTADEQRPYTWTSADAAGLPIFPGLARYDEVAAGVINHALRFTLDFSRAAFTPPASHWAATSTNADAAPMGMRLRLKANFDISGFSATNQIILNAMKKYGLIMADNGSNMFISGAPDARWSNDDLHNLGSVTNQDFDVVEMNSIYTSATLPTGAAPSISSFTASSQSVSAGTPVTLSWVATGASYLIVSPDIGATRGTSVVVTPLQSATYTLYATNAFGRTTATVDITVH
ncbi:MAG TPA: IPT/TIG domain-containing protein [Candidatus Acidoferrales bacterium]|nr:IPT/TIG domain-containing protein [Candidatus Acidoferrales bacterium]